MKDIKRYMVFGGAVDALGGMDDLAFSSDDLEEAIKFYNSTYTAIQIFDRIEGKIIDVQQTGTPMPPRPVIPKDYQHEEKPWITPPSEFEKQRAEDIDRRMEERL